MATIVQSAVRHELAGQGAPGHVVEAGQGAIHLPDDMSLTTASFDRVGNSLSITRPDGGRMVVRGYFVQESPAELISPDGSRMSGELASQLAGPSAPGQVAHAGFAPAAKPAGVVENVRGTVVAVHANGMRVELRTGDALFQGDVLETASEGAIGIVLADDTALSMGENGRMVLDEMTYDPATQEGSLVLSVVQGVFTVLTGRIARTDPDAMHVDTPVATIAIRRTQLGVDIGREGKVHVVLMSEMAGFVGEVVVLNDGGVTIMNTANQLTMVAASDVAPAPMGLMDAGDIVDRYAAPLLHLPATGNDGFGPEARGEARGDAQPRMHLDMSGLNGARPVVGGVMSAAVDGLADESRPYVVVSVADEVVPVDATAAPSDSGADNSPLTDAPVGGDAAAVDLPVGDSRADDATAALADHDDADHRGIGHDAVTVESVTVVSGDDMSAATDIGSSEFRSGAETGDPGAAGIVVAGDDALAPSEGQPSDGALPMMEDREEADDEDVSDVGFSRFVAGSIPVSDVIMPRLSEDAGLSEDEAIHSEVTSPTPVLIPTDNIGGDAVLADQEAPSDRWVGDTLAGEDRVDGYERFFGTRGTLREAGPLDADGIGSALELSFEETSDDGRDLTPGATGNDSLDVTVATPASTDDTENHDGHLGTDSVFNVENPVEEIDGSAGHDSQDSSVPTLKNLDDIHGSRGHDVLIGSSDNNVILGSVDNGLIVGGAYGDTRYDNQGSERFFVSVPARHIAGLAGGDAVEDTMNTDNLGVSAAALANIDEIHGGSGHDTIIGSSDDDAEREHPAVIAAAGNFS